MVSTLETYLVFKSVMVEMQKSNTTDFFFSFFLTDTLELQQRMTLILIELMLQTSPINKKIFLKTYLTPLYCTYN